MSLLVDILEAPSAQILENFLARIPMISKLLVLSPHGYFGQDNVLGLPDTGGQVVYISGSGKGSGTGHERAPDPSRNNGPTENSDRHTPDPRGGGYLVQPAVGKNPRYPELMDCACTIS